MSTQYLEKKVAEKVIADLLKAGYLITVNDSEEDVLENSSDPKAIFEAMFSSDEDYLFVSMPGKICTGCIHFVYGNSGWDVINDYTTNLESALADVWKLTDEMSK